MIYFLFKFHITKLIVTFPPQSSKVAPPAGGHNISKGEAKIHLI